MEDIVTARFLQMSRKNSNNIDSKQFESIKLTTMKLPSLIFLTVFVFFSCNNQAKQSKQLSIDSSKVDTSVNVYAKQLTEKEKLSSTKNVDTLGNLISEIDFHVTTNNVKDYKDGFIPYIAIENPEKEINDLIDKNKIVIPKNKVTIIIDYP